MAKRWKCPRCSSSNDETSMGCGRCGLLRGSVVPVGPWTAGSYGQAPPPPATPAPGTLWLPPAADPESSMPSAAFTWLRTGAGIVIFVVLVALGPIRSWLTDAERSWTGEIFKTGDMSVYDLRVGDCYDLKDPTVEEVDIVIARPCADAHEYELYYIGTMREGTYPDDAAVGAFVDSACMPAFDEYVGKNHDESELGTFSLSPGREAWASGDRTVQCSVYRPGIPKMTGSLKGSAR